MTQFPAVDPIPLPAPVWLFKLLHNLTLTLHLAAVDLLLGGLTIGLILLMLGSFRNRQDWTQTGGILVHRLPTVMAFVINLGVPPLLFAQVLYGRALYTSSVLIGAYWISVIFLLMASYYGLYFSAKRAEAQRSWISTGTASLLLILTIAFIYSNNMTLMLRPQVWAGMYGSNPTGAQLNTSDPTLLPRYLFFIASAFPATGAALMLLARRKHLDESAKRVLWHAGGAAILTAIFVEGGFALMTVSAQPPDVWSAVRHNTIYGACSYAWIATAILLAISGGVAIFSRIPSMIVGIAAALVAFLNTAATVMVRDGIRDMTLRMAGFEVWDRQVASNWSVVGIFLILFVAALATIGYLIFIVAGARPIKETYV